ncbi:hypothetical protein H5968_17010 [Sphaerospermopsis sp. LEGE 00249]|jgi:hypothetical protein|uniref:hypothetical protein n=1 Tax=Sphaerospermopsis sp. LEGE 00249 TaxID=1380707 RepID=UPI00164DEB6E|nr:hypothetical protein [Sphaerospermopsis sp. LEGE 00249]MBC5796804.1 hypothetical protein [Sphaerospermopsis sp. LEGE 00249]
MLNTFSTHRIFGFLLTALMLTSCSGGTSSNTDTGTNQAQNNSGGGNTPQGQTLTVSIPSLRKSYTIIKGQTTVEDIASVVSLDRNNCRGVFAIGSRSYANCTSEVMSAARQALNFIGS